LVIAPHNIPLIRIAHLKTAATTGNFAERAKWKGEIAQKIYSKGWANRYVFVKYYNLIVRYVAASSLKEAE